VNGTWYSCLLPSAYYFIVSERRSSDMNRPSKKSHRLQPGSTEKGIRRPGWLNQAFGEASFRFQDRLGKGSANLTVCATFAVESCGEQSLSPGRWESIVNAERVVTDRNSNSTSLPVNPGCSLCYLRCSN
jgi:hypothetical protein